MRIAAALLLIGAPAALAGCGGGHDATLNEEQAAAAEQRAPDPQKVLRDRWSQLFANPTAVVAAANELELASTPYQAQGAGFAAKGAVSLPREPGPVTVKAQFGAAGKTADQIDTISFTFDVASKGKVDVRAADAYRYPLRLIIGFLQRFQVGTGDQLNAALRRFESAKADLPGASAVVDSQPIKGGDARDRRITVTFTRIGASAPANQTQGK